MSFATETETVVAGATSPSRHSRADEAGRTVKCGESLYRANDPFRSIYAVYAGSFKTVIAHGDGE